MKKMIFVFILAGIGSSFLSCKEPEPMIENEKYKTLIQYLEENKMDDAYEDLVEILQPQDEVEEDVLEKKREVLQGEWVTERKDSGIPKKIVFEADGTCLYGDGPYTWEILTGNIEKAIVEIKLDKKRVCTYTLEYDRKVEKYCIYKNKYNKYPYGLEWEPLENPRYYKS